MSEQDVLRIRANMAKRNLTLKDIDKVPCEVGLMIEEGFPHTGHLDYAAPEVDPSTGTLLVRCIFENKDRGLNTPVSSPARGCRSSVRRARRCWCRMRPSGPASSAAICCW